FFFFFNDTATTEIYTLSLHDALPIFHLRLAGERRRLARRVLRCYFARAGPPTSILHHRRPPAALLRCVPRQRHLPRFGTLDLPTRRRSSAADGAPSARRQR